MGAATLAGAMSMLVMGQSMFVSQPTAALAAITFVVPLLAARHDATTSAVIGGVLGSALIPLLSIYSDTTEGRVFGLVYALIALAAALAGALLGRRFLRPD